MVVQDQCFLGSYRLLAQVLSDAVADDVQLYLALNVDWEDSLHPLLSHLRDIKTWLGNNFLKFKTKKAEVKVFKWPGLSCWVFGALHKEMVLNKVICMIEQTTEPEAAVWNHSFIHPHSLIGDASEITPYFLILWGEC